MVACLLLLGCGHDSSTGVTPAPAATPAAADPAPRPAEGPLSTTLAAGTVITVNFTYLFDSSSTEPGQYMYSVIDEDVKGADGRVALPAGATVTMVVRESGRKGAISHVKIGLYAAYIGGRSYPFSDGDSDAASLSFTEDAGQGSAHSSVHIERGTRLPFKLSTAVQLH